MMLREAIEDAIARGEKLRHEIGQEIVNSHLFADLANNPRFVNAVALVIRSKDEVARSLQRRFKETMEMMRIPTREQVRDYEKRVLRLEKELDSVARKMMYRDVSSPIKKTTKKKTVAKASAKKTKAKKSSRTSRPKSRSSKRTKAS